ncbi:rCG35443 [Rattus norvegicus]|uniref:RCG35443 n=1 Tax=Rattus norvegicus TaxID=10116 RepID=A6HIK4_RAT|nr:rCG35443 [Rattus norvegicus]
MDGYSNLSCGYGCAGRCVRGPLCVCEYSCACVCARVPSSLHHSPGSPPKLRPHPPSQSPQHVNPRPLAPRPPAACASPLSISVCLTRETATSGTLYLVPSPLPAVLCYSHGGVLSAPFHNILFP